MGNPYNVFEGLQDSQHTSLQNQLLGQQIETGKLEQQGMRDAQQKTRAISSLLSQQPTPPLPTQAAPESTVPIDRTPEIQSLTQNSQKLIEAGNKIMSLDPKMGNTFITQGRELESTAIELDRQNLAEQKYITSHILSWAGTIHSQAELDNARTMVEARHPGIWASMKLPSTYDASTAPKFQQLSLSASTALQQTELKLKQIELSTGRRYYEARAAEKEQQAVKARTDAAIARENLSRKQTTGTAFDKYQTELEKENNTYETALVKARQAIIMNPAKYPDKAPEPTSMARIQALWGDAPPVRLSARQQALASVEQEQQKAHTARVAGIQRKASALGITVPNGKPAESPASNQYGSQEEVLGKLKASNPDATDQELEAYARDKGYIQ
jgi:hypothetical protein